MKAIVRLTNDRSDYYIQKLNKLLKYIGANSFGINEWELELLKLDDLLKFAKDVDMKLVVDVCDNDIEIEIYNDSRE